MLNNKKNKKDLYKKDLFFCKKQNTIILSKQLNNTLFNAFSLLKNLKLTNNKITINNIELDFIIAFI